MSIVKHRTLERITKTDIMLARRFGRRATDRLAAYRARQPRVWGPEANTVTLEGDIGAGGACLGGLEVSRVNSDTASQLRVSAGGLLLPIGALAEEESRPVTWSGKTESDDATYAVFELVSGLTLAPSTVIAGALAAAEWWIVYALPVVETVESDTNSPVFNQSTGVLDVSTQPKVTRHGLSVAIARGTSGQNLAHASLVLPAGAIQLAFVWVPSGATDLSGAMIFDTRVLLDPGPNTVETAGMDFATGPGLSGPVTAPFGVSSKALRGVVRARLNGEWLECRTSTGMTLDILAEPSPAAWGSPSSPTLSYLYLCKVRSVVPRLVRIGDKPAGSSTVNVSTFQAGVLVLSPRPPQLRAASGPPHKAQQRWDLRNAQPISLPRQTFTGASAYEYAFAGCSADVGEAICVGVMIHSAYDGVNNVPNVIAGWYMDRNGWISGEAVVTGSAAFVDTNTPGTTGAATITASVLIKTVTVGGTPWAMPIDGLRTLLRGTISGSGGDFISWQYQQWIIEMPVLSGGVPNYRHVGEAWAATPGGIGFSTHKGAVTGQTFTAATQDILALRFPVREPLITGPLSS